MNKKGFTIVELIATIAILALLLLIGVSSSNIISNRIKERQRINLITKIEIAASRYATDYEVTVILLEDLIKFGYITSEKDGNIYDPVNNEILNCYRIDIEKEKNYNRAKFTNENYNEDGRCNSESLNNDNLELTIIKKHNGQVVTNNEWIKGELELTAVLNNEEVDCQSNICKWTSNSGFVQNNTNTIVLDNQKSMNSTISFRLKLNSSDNYTYLSNDTKVKLDNNAPLINKVDLDNTALNKIDVKISAIDSESGIKGYYIAFNDVNCNEISDRNYLNNNEQSLNYNNENKLTVCVKDNVGNTSTYSKNISSSGNNDNSGLTIKMTNIDGNVEKVAEDGTWYKGKMKLEAYFNGVLFDCPNNDSANCHWCISGKCSFQNEHNNYLVLDNPNGVLDADYEFYYYEGGNSISSKVKVKLDNIAPRINNVSVTDKPNNTKEFVVEATDSESGISGYYMTFGNINCSEIRISNYGISNKKTLNYNNETNYTVCVKDNAGNITSYKNNINGNNNEIPIIIKMTNIDGNIVQEAHEGTWYKGNMKLEALQNGELVDCSEYSENNTECIWELQRNLGSSIRLGYGNTYVIEANNDTQNNYNYMFLKFDYSMNLLIAGEDSIFLKLDNQEPMAYLLWLNTNKNQSIVNQKNCTSNITFGDINDTFDPYQYDNNGSGISEFAYVPFSGLATNTNNSWYVENVCRSNSISWQESRSFTNVPAMKYYNYVVCVKDSVGNIGGVFIRQEVGTDSCPEIPLNINN